MIDVLGSEAEGKCLVISFEFLESPLGMRVGVRFRITNTAIFERVVCKLHKTIKIMLHNVFLYLALV